MRGPAHHGRVNSFDQRIDIDELMREIERYLAAVEVFRAAGCDVGGIERRLQCESSVERSVLMHGRRRR